MAAISLTRMKLFPQAGKRDGWNFRLHIVFFFNKQYLVDKTLKWRQLPWCHCEDVSCKRKFNFGTEVGVKVGYFCKIYHSPPGCALVMTCSMTIHQVAMVGMEKNKDQNSSSNFSGGWRRSKMTCSKTTHLPMEKWEEEEKEPIDYINNEDNNDPSHWPQTIWIHFKFVCETVRWDFKDAVIWKGFETSMTSLM